MSKSNTRIPVSPIIEVKLLKKVPSDNLPDLQDGLKLNKYTLSRSKTNSDTVKTDSGDEIKYSPRRSSKSQKNHRNNEVGRWNTIPSPASGISDECLAMANACNHDHDYVVYPVTTSNSKEFAKSNDSDIELNRTIISGSMPAIKSEFSTEPKLPNREFKPIPPPVIIDAANRTSTLSKATRRPSVRRSTKSTCNVNKLFFTSDSMTSARSSKTKTSSGNKLTAKVYPKIDLDSRTSCDKDTAMLSNNKNNNNDHFSDSESELDLKDNNLLTVMHSTPAKSIYICDISSPRPSITPLPPTGQRRHSHSRIARRRAQQPTKESGNEIPKLSNLEVEESNDSAYSSLSCSASSHPRTPSGGRPQSGEKRGATSNLSSSSSSSNDDYSDLDTSRSDDDSCFKHDSNEPQIKSENGGKTNIPVAHIPKLSAKKSNKKIVKLLHSDEDNLQKNVAERQKFMPTPPVRKIKKGGRLHEPLPMRLRALPTSFWQEPNKANPSPYNVLPPVQLFKHADMDDVADIRSVSPTGEENSNTLPSHSTTQMPGAQTKPKVVVKTYDPDLLLRLFDKVENKDSTRPKGIRVKRGRPRRNPRCAMPAPRIPFNEDPYIIDSITDKLFPKLSLEHKKRGIVNSTPSLPDALNQNASFTYDAPKLLMGDEYDVTNAMTSQMDNFLDSDLDVFNDRANASSPTGLRNSNDSLMDLGTLSPPLMTSQRPSAISFPQLNTSQDFPQMLSELAAIL